MAPGENLAGGEEKNPLCISDGVRQKSSANVVQHWSLEKTDTEFSKGQPVWLETWREGQRFKSAPSLKQDGVSILKEV